MIINDIFNCHNQSEIKQFGRFDRKVLDGRQPIKKPYLMVLTRLPQILGRQTNAIPSNQPGLYYHLLLGGESVEPNLGVVAYREVQAGRPLHAPPHRHRG